MRAELTRAPILPCAAAPVSRCPLRTVTGLGTTDFAVFWLGAGSANSSVNGAFSMTNVRQGTHDFVAYRHDQLRDVTGTGNPDRAVIRRDQNIAVPFNLFANTKSLWNTVAERGWDTPPEPTAAWEFMESAPEGGEPAAQVDIPYPRPAFRVNWAYDPNSERWERAISGQPHIDKVEGKPISAANIVILTANHVQTLIAEQGTKLGRGPCSNASVEIQLWG
jgi:hypothetical protein